LHRDRVQPELAVRADADNDGTRAQKRAAVAEALSMPRRVFRRGLAARSETACTYCFRTNEPREEYG